MTEKKHTCPFWSPSAGNCTVSLDGLFIPMDNHIDTFCNSRSYTGCFQYQCKNTFQKLDDAVSDRRQHRRHADSRDITLIKNEHYPEDVQIPVMATIIDFSKGGVRLLLKENLSRNSAVTCTLGNDLPEHLRTGPAMIRWCRPLLNKNGYQAGLAFKDEVLPMALGSCLEPR